MQKIVIVCNDLFGIEVYSLIQEINHWHMNREMKPLYDPVAFLSLCDKPFGEVPSPLTKIGRMEDLKRFPDAKVVLGINGPKEKASAVEALRTNGAVFETVVAPWMLSRREWLTVGEGSVICGYSIKPIMIGSFVTIVSSMISGHHIDDFSTVMRFANIAGDSIGKRSYVGNHVFLAVGKSIGDDCYVEDGSIVVKNVRHGTKVFGNPAHRMDF